MTGDHFRLIKEDGRWHWELLKSHSPQVPMARSRKKGYDSPADARRSIKSVCDAARGASREGTPRIDDQIVQR